MRFVEIETDMPGQMAAVLNFARRHMTVSQKSMCAANGIKFDQQQAAERQRSGGLAHECAKGKATETMAIKAGISPRSIEQAIKITERGAPELVTAVSEDKVAVSDAAKIADLPKADQCDAVAAVESGKAKTVTEAVRRLPKNSGALNDFPKLGEILIKAGREAEKVNRAAPDDKCYQKLLAGIEACRSTLKAWQKCAQ